MLGPSAPRPKLSGTRPALAPRRRGLVQRLESRFEAEGTRAPRRPRLQPPRVMRNHRPLLLLAALLALWLQPGSAYAYVDPNAGGLLFQLLAPVFAAAVGGWLFLRRWITEVVRSLWHRLTGRRPE